MVIAAERPRVNGARAPFTRLKIDLEEINKTNGFTPRVQRLKQRYLEAVSRVCAERAELVTESFKLTEGEHPCKRRAKAWANVFAKMPIAIRDDELIVGAPTPYVRGAHPNVEADPFQLELVLQNEKVTTCSTVQEAILTVEDKEKLLAACEYWKEHWWSKRINEVAKTYAGGIGRYLAEARMVMGALTYGGFSLPGHLCPGADYDKLFRVGCNGIIAEAQAEIDRILEKPHHEFTGEDKEKLEFLESVIICLEGIIHFARRHAALARELAAKETDPQRKKELERIAETCEHVPANPARNFYEALQSYWFIVVAHEIEKAQPNHFAGRFDQYMYPFYERDIAEGRMTRQEAAELLGCMFVKWMTLEAFVFTGLMGKREHQEVSPGNYFAHVTLGGVTTTGLDASNELSCLVLHVAKQVKAHQPHICLRYHRAMAPELLQKALECTRDHGGGIPAWFNDRLAIQYLLERGCSLEDARDWAAAGCINIGHQKSFVYERNPGPNFIHHAKLIELTLNDGIDPFTGQRLGAATGDPRNFRTFEELLEAYKKQIAYHYDLQWNFLKLIEPLVAEDRPYYPLQSAFLQDCIKRGKDASRGGDRYHQELEGPCFVDRALTDAADCLAALKKVVFEEGVPMSEVLDALKADFEGYEELWKRLKDAPKFGNDDDYVDSIAFDIWQYTVEKALSYRDSEGRRPILFRQGAAWSTYAATTVKALPNGKKAFAPLADASASPGHGCDVKGPTAVLNSVSKLDAGHMEGPLLNLKFTPGVLRSKEGMQKLADMIATYMDRGGFQVQFNILNTDTLRDAMEHPERYRDLVVRLAGYSVFWVDLSRDVQEEIIARTEHAL